MKCDKPTEESSGASTASPSVHLKTGKGSESSIDGKQNLFTPAACLPKEIDKVERENSSD